MHGKLAFVRVWDRAACVCVCVDPGARAFFFQKLVFSPPSRWSNETGVVASCHSRPRGVRVRRAAMAG